MPKKVVIIEDEENVGKLIQSYLAQHKYESSHLRDGTAGLKIIEASPPDLVLIDLLLPGLHGFEICTKLKKDPKLQHIPIIVMTAVYKSSMDKMEAKRIGVEDFVEKPLDFPSLIGKINKLTGQTSPEPESMPEMDHVLKEQVQELQKNYLEQLPEKIEGLEKQWAYVLQSPGNQARLLELRRLTHSLTGSGATFGFDEISKGAQKLEQLLDRVLESGGSSVDARKHEINQFLDNMRHHPIVATGKQMRRAGSISI